MPNREPNSPAVVFIHGIGGAGRVWASQAASFRLAGFMPVAPDLPGYGARPPVGRCTSRSWRRMSRRRSPRAVCDRPVLVGHSMGGMVAQTMLRRRPDGYAAAVLACTSPAFGNPSGEFPEEVRRRQAGAARRRQDHGRSRAAAWSKRIIGPAADPAARALAIEVMGAVPADTYRAAVRCLVDFDERANLASISRARALPRRREGSQRAAAGDGAHGRQDPGRPRTSAFPASAICRISRRRRPSMLLFSTFCEEVRSRP